MHFHLTRSPLNPARRRGRFRIRPVLMTLEERALLSLSIQINYDYDTNDFFNTQAKKDAMQSVANQVAATINDHLAAIVPSGTDTWGESFIDPSTGEDREVDNQVLPADTLIVYVGGRDLGPSIAAEASPGVSVPISTVPITGANLSAYLAWADVVMGRGKAGALDVMASAFGPWGGSISFNTSDQFEFGGDGQPPGTISFTSPQNFAAVAWHELGHILGIGSAPSWFRYVTPSGFTGPYAEAVYGGPVPLELGGAHWAAGVIFDGMRDLMDGGGDSQAVGTSGTTPRDPVFSSLDYKALEDIGWSVQPPVMAAIPQATGIVSVKHSKKGVTTITIGFNEALNPASADNVSLYSVLDGVRVRKKTVYSRPVTIRNVIYDGTHHTVAIKLAKPQKGIVLVTVRSGMLAADGASSSNVFSAVVK